jgi:membrane fusion protein (multidrug efflux system)
MADSRSIVAGVSVAVALLCAAWAIYSSKHSASRGAQNVPPFAAGARAPGGGQGAPSGPAQAVISVVTVPARNESINVGIEAIGTANSNEAVDVSSKTSNIVTAIHFRDGQQVKAGDILVELDRAQASAELAASTADYGDSVSQFNRSRELYATQSLSKAQYEQLEATMKANEARVAAARAKVTDTYIRAPFSGRVGLRRVSLGTLISPGTVITTLDDTSAIKVDFAVPDVYVGELREGQTVKATTTAYTGRSFDGRVVSVDSRIDPTTRSVTVRAVVPNRDSALKPGMFLTVQLAKEQRKALVIPEEALVPEQARQFVYVMKSGVVAKREVRIGRREPGRVEVAEGLVEGDRVVTEGTLKLREGAAVQELQVASSPAVRAAS